jgi:hypothetical protein
MSTLRAPVATTAAGLAIALLLPAACGTETLGTDSAEPDAGTPDAEPAFDLELFAQAGTTFRFTVSPEMATQMDNRQWGGIEAGFGGWDGDPYTVGGGGGPEVEYTYADDVTVTTVDGTTRSFGKVATWTIGQSSFRPWDGIPNIRVDTGKVEDGLKIGGFEDFRFNNGQVGGIFREAIALRFWDAMGYPTPETTFAWVEAPNQWDEARVPMTLVEVYKKPWATREVDPDVRNIWEGVGEPWYFANDPQACQIGTCDGTRLVELGDVAQTTPLGPGYTDALADYVDWDTFRQFMCLSWITCTGDDYLHNTNNVLVVERADGKFQFHPYSVDISASQDWYQYTPLMGTSQLARGCQTDPECWAELLTTCDEMLDTMAAMDPAATIVQPVLDAIEDNGMMRPGDDERAQQVYDWYQGREGKLRFDEAWTVEPCYSDEQCEETEYCDWWSSRCYDNGGGGGEGL